MSKRLTTKEFITRATKIHGDKYDYSNTIYINSYTKVKIKCQKHGIFEQRPTDHLSNKHCRLCSYELRHDNMALTTEEFIRKSEVIHNNFYDYSKSIYTRSCNNIEIICPIHGKFTQKANHHISGHGCKLCNISKGENIIETILTNNDIPHIREYTFDSCRSSKNTFYKLPFDFYLPNHNICIEYDGEQHYTPKSYFGGISAYTQTTINDKTKTLYCELNNIMLIRIPYWEIDNIEKILTSIVL